jgi:hypothetical protein
MLLVALSLAVPSSTRGVSIEEALAARRAWRERVTSVKMQTRSKWRYETINNDGERQLEEREGTGEWTWDEVGWFHSASTTSKDGRVYYRSLHIQHLERNYRFHFSSDNPGDVFPTQVHIDRIAPYQTASPTGEPGRWYFDSTRRPWLPDLLATLTEFEETPDGKFEYDAHDYGHPQTHITLDPEHNYLPCRTRSDGHNDRQVIDEFREIEPGLWFPWRGHEEGGNDLRSKEWEMVSLEINPELTSADFAPLLGPETYVIDNVSERAYWAAGQAPPGRETPSVQFLSDQLAAQERRREIEQEQQQWQLPERKWLWTGGLGAVVIIVTAGLYFRRRKGGRKVDAIADVIREA